MNLIQPVVNIDLITESDLHVDILRDDLAFPAYPGNKWRKLLPFVEKAKHADKTITYGGPFSNHLAAFGKAVENFGFKGEAIIRGEDDANNPTLKKLRDAGVKLTFVSREEYRMTRAGDTNALGDERILIIPEGGAGPEAVLSCMEITSSNPGYDFYLCATGTGTTVAGMLSGLEGKDRSMVVSVPVVRDKSLEIGIGDLLTKSGRNMELIRRLKLVSGYEWGGYGKVKPELIEFVNGIYNQTGIPLDLIYTGKMFFAFLDMVKKKEFKPGSRILLVHTGGLQGNTGMVYRGLANGLLPVLNPE